MIGDIVERLRSLRHIHLPQLSDEAAAEIERLRAGQDEWMHRSLNHALEADRYREEVINLKGRLYQKERAS